MSQIRYVPSDDNYEFLMKLQKQYKAKGYGKRGLSMLVDRLITDKRLEAENNDFNSRIKG